MSEWGCVYVYPWIIYLSVSVFLFCWCFCFCLSEWVWELGERDLRQKAESGTKETERMRERENERWREGWRKGVKERKRDKRVQQILLRKIRRRGGNTRGSRAHSATSKVVAGRSVAHRMTITTIRCGWWQTAVKITDDVSIQADPRRGKQLSILGCADMQAVHPGWTGVVCDTKPQIKLRWQRIIENLNLLKTYEGLSE